MRPGFASLLLAAALVLPAAWAQPQAGAPAAPKPFQGEQLLFDVPDGWSVVQTRSYESGAQRSRVAVMAPARQGPGRGSEQLVAMTLVHDHTAPQRYLESAAAQSAKLCAHQTLFPPQAAMEDGYPSQTQHRYCEHDRRDGFCRTFVTKALGGQDSLYVVSYIKAYPCAESESYSESEAQRWDDYFSSVSLCDKRRDDCPAEGRPTPRIAT